MFAPAVLSNRAVRTTVLLGFSLAGLLFPLQADADDLINGARLLGHVDELSGQVTMETSGAVDFDDFDQHIDTLSATDGSGTQIFLGTATLTVGSGFFDGSIQDGGISNHAPGSLVKVGAGTLTL